MGFWKKHSYQVVRLFIIQIGITIFGLVLSFAVSTAFRERDDQIPLLMVSIFSVLFYLFLLYSVAWEMGGKDRLSLDARHASPRGGSGATVGGRRVFGIGYFLEPFLNSMYLGIIRVLLGATGLEQDMSRTYFLVTGLLFLLATLPAILVVGFGYWMGMYEKRIIPARRTGNDGKNS